MRRQLVNIAAFCLACVFTLSCAGNATMKPSSGQVDEYLSFPSGYVSDRDVFVWLPDGYSKENKYDVLYMHDGQMLFDSTCTWNKQEWMADEVAAKLISQKLVRPFIIVGASSSDTRYQDYFPEKITDYFPEGLPFPAPKDSLYADEYLRFLVEELKPFIDSVYSTNAGTEHTFVAGSSMGGLISLYAICEYPEVFGGAACISTHTPLVLSSSMDTVAANAYFGAFERYLADNLPEANTRYIYMDRGDATLDAYYPPYQDALDRLMVKEGWRGPYWVSETFPGAAHMERDWAARLHVPFVFLLGQDK